MRYCDGIRRRDFVKFGSVAAGLGLLGHARMARGEALPVATSGKAAILVFLAGGASHYETYDPKPNAPLEIRGPFHPISTSVPGLQFCEALPRQAKLADKVAIIRSCCHTNAGHGGGQRWAMTGYNSASPEFELPHDYPAVGSIVAKLRGPNRKGLPAYVAAPPWDYLNDSTAFLGPACAPLGLYSNGRLERINLTSVIKPDRMQSRRELRESLDRLQRDVDKTGMMQAMDSLEQQAFEMVTGPAARDAVDLSREPAQTLERYGDHNWGKSCLLARRLVEAGVTFVTVNMSGWDQHGSAGGTIEEAYSKTNAPPFDAAVAALIEDLFGRGMDKDVMLLVWGEFGRTPKINNTGGRDHWPQAMSALMAGGGIRGGQVIGATDRKGEAPIDRALGPADVLATLYHHFGIDHHRQFTNSAGRPVGILPEGEPIPELVANG